MPLLVKAVGYWSKKRCKEEAQKYKSRADFKRTSPSAYSAACKNNWLQELCGHMTLLVKPVGYWTKERCREHALKFTSKSEFRAGSPSAYSAARKNLWVTEICEHMIPTRHPNGFWTKVRCKEEALKYQSRKLFLKGSPSAYVAASKHKWLPEVCAHMTLLAKPVGYWTEERCQEEALKFNTKSEFSKGAPSAYVIACRNKWTKKICRHMEALKRTDGYWSRKRCKKEAIKYTSRSAFKKGSPASYSAARKKGWLAQLCSKMPLLVKPVGHWNKERCQGEARKYTLRSNFKKFASGAYTSAIDNGWLEEICQHMDRMGHAYKRAIYVFEFDDNSAYVGLSKGPTQRKQEHIARNLLIKDKLQRHQYAFKVLSDFLVNAEAVKLEADTIGQYQQDGWKVLNKAKAGSLGGIPLKWTYASCKAEAEKYKSRSEFKKNAQGAYSAAQTNGWLEDLQLPRQRHQRNFWTREHCQEEALKYGSRAAFKRGCPSAYAVAGKKNWLQEICAHMTVLVNPVGYWMKERCWEEALKYKSRADFKDGSPSAYGAASKKQWLREVCAHMPLLVKPVGYWTKERCLEEALMSKTKAEFHTRAPSAYSAAKKNRWVADICCHMIPEMRQAAIGANKK